MFFGVFGHTTADLPCSDLMLADEAAGGFAAETGLNADTAYMPLDSGRDPLRT